LWTPFFTLFGRYWSDCDLPVYLGTNCAQVNFEHVHTLNAGGEEAWSKRLRSLLQTIGTDYVLLLLEDFFLDQTVSNTKVKNHLKILHSLDGVSMRLFPNPPADYFQGGVGVIHNRAAFRVSLQAAIWNRSRLLQLLVDEESIWDFETCGSRRSQAWPSGFYCASEAVIHYQHVVERGEWFRPAARAYDALNVGCDFQARPVMGLLKAWKKKPANLLRRFVNKLRSHWLCIRYPESLSDAS
jgi:hypothetical protein